MKIFNYMNNTNSIMEKNTDKVQKGNSQTNEKHTVGQSVKLSISNEGLEYYRNRIQQSGQEKYDDVVQRKELLASKKISDIDYSYEIQKKAAQQNQNGDTGMYDQMKSTMESLGIDEERLKNMSNEEVDQYVKEMCKKFGISQSLFDKLKDRFGK